MVRKYRIFSSSSIKNVIDITIHFDYENSDIAAGMFINHPSIRKKYKISQAQLDELDEFIGNVLSMLYNFGFKIIGKGQSRKGYSYYIDFYPVDSEGNTLELWQIRFRISDHRQNTGKDRRTDRIDDMTVRSNKSHVLIKSFEIGQGRKFTTLSSAMLEMKRICESLRDGEYF